MKILAKILLGFGLTLVILAGSIIYTASQVSENIAVNQRVTDIRMPTAMNGLQILNGVNHSLAALRGWIILGKDKFVTERQTAWDQIDQATGDLTKLSANWTVEANKKKLGELVVMLEEFRGHQKEIEDIANTVEHRPDLKILLNQAAPRAGIMGKEITAMIDKELTLKATAERRQLLGMMADVRGTLGLGLANIRAYLLSGDESFKIKFEKLWAKNDRRFADLQNNSGLLKDEQATSFANFAAARAEFVEFPPQMFEIRGGNQYDLANFWLGSKAAPMAFKIKESLGAMTTNQQGLLETDALEAKTMLSSLLTLLWILLGIGIVLSAGVGITLGRAIANPINKVVQETEKMNDEFTDFIEIVNAIAANDLTQEIKITEISDIGITSSDETGILARSIESTLKAKGAIGEALNKMIRNLNQVIKQLANSATELGSAATEIASSSEQMSKGANDQSQQVNQVSTAIEEMTATILETSKNAGDATDTSKSASDTAGNGGQIVSDTIQGMQKIASVVKESADSIAKLAKSADQIGEIIGVIDDIADQTNLLALNAAIEAARAGEQGRGFAVVADEVRKLAERTGKATGEITEMIKGIQSETEEAVGSMESGIQEVEKGRELADQAGNALNEVVNMSQRVMDMIQQIATAAEEQSTAAEEISKNVEHISSVTKETATGAEQSATAAEELSQQAEGLKKIVAQFKVAESA